MSKARGISRFATCYRIPRGLLALKSLQLWKITVIHRVVCTHSDRYCKEFSLKEPTCSESFKLFSSLCKTRCHGGFHFSEMISMLPNFRRETNVPISQSTHYIVTMLRKRPEFDEQLSPRSRHEGGRARRAAFELTSTIIELNLPNIRLTVGVLDPTAWSCISFAGCSSRRMLVWIPSYS